jgi:hypothetical protein
MEGGSLTYLYMPAPVFPRCHSPPARNCDANVRRKKRNTKEIMGKSSVNVIFNSRIKVVHLKINAHSYYTII